MRYTLVLGNKNYSSWSMRAWLLMRLANLAFDEISIPLYRPDSRDAVRRHGGQTGLVPLLIDDGFPIWDTLAIAERLYEHHPQIWPRDHNRRARARSYSGEVHSSLAPLRNAMPVNTRGRNRQAVISPAVEADIARVFEIWRTAGGFVEGPWLFGDFCAADILFAPLATRFQTYGIKPSGGAEIYCDQLLNHPLVVEWLALGQAETDVIPEFELPEGPTDVRN